MKKRVLAIVLVISMVSVTACGAKKQDASKNQKIRFVLSNRQISRKIRKRLMRMNKAKNRI